MNKLIPSFTILTEILVWAIKSDPLELTVKSVAQPLGPQQNHWGLIRKRINKLQQVGMILSLMLNRKVGALDPAGITDSLRWMGSVVSFPSFSLTLQIT